MLYFSYIAEQSSYMFMNYRLVKAKETLTELHFSHTN